MYALFIANIYLHYLQIQYIHSFFIYRYIISYIHSLIYSYENAIFISISSASRIGESCLYSFEDSFAFYFSFITIINISYIINSLHFAIISYQSIAYFIQTVLITYFLIQCIEYSLFIQYTLYIQHRSRKRRYSIDIDKREMILKICYNISGLQRK